MRKLIFLSLIVSAVNAAAQTAPYYKSATGYEWVNGAWVPDYRQSNTVDKNGYLINNMDESWIQSSSAWQPSGQTSYTNNSSGQEIRALYQYWNNFDNAWMMSSVKQSTYNASKKVTTDLSQHLSSVTPINAYMNNYFYDAKGHLISREYNTWTAGAWKLVSRTTYTNNSDGFPTQTLYESLVSGSWQNEQVINNSYFSKGKISESVSQDWTTSGWENDYRYTQGYDQFGFLVSAEDYEWFNNAWIQSSRYTVTNLSDGRMDFYIGEVPNGNVWEKYEKVVFDWSSAVATGITEQSDTDLLQPVIYFDFNGRQVEKQKNVMLIEQRGNVRKKVIIQGD